jgi:exonuclease SbcD
MRLLHTSDWHLGRTLHGASLLSAQRDFLRWLCGLAVDRQVDAVVVAGDVYDRAVPPTDAVSLLDEVLVELSRARIPVLLTSGNHDSAIRLGFGRALHELAGVHLRTRVADLAVPVVLDDRDGPIGLYGIPYLLPDAVMAELDAGRSHAAVLGAAVARIRDDANQRGLGRTVVAAHAFVTGARPSESERDIRVGGIGDAPAAVFDGLTYTALGHLHGQQRLTDRVRYSGSPLAFSFSEAGHVKSVSVVHIDGDGALEVELVPVPVYRGLAEVRGRLDELITRAGPDLLAIADRWVKVVLTDPHRPRAPMERLREVWPHTLVLDFQPDGARTAAPAQLVRVSESSEPLEICAAFLEWVDSTRPSAGQRSALESAIDAVARAELSA